MPFGVFLKRKFKVILFDLGGVVVDVNNDHYIDYISRVSGRSWHKAKETVYRYTRLMEKDGIGMRDFNRGVAMSLGMNRKDVKWLEFYKKHVGIIDNTVALIRKLKGKYRIACLSNIDHVKYRYTRKILDFSIFNRRFTSCNMRMAKPERRIFRTVVKKLNVKPEEILFIDNDIRNVREARKVGICSIHYIGFRRLVKKLNGLLSDGV